MRKTVKLAGTQLVLPAGIEVELTPATNLPPGRGVAFARPVTGWFDILGYEQPEDVSILLDADDFEEITDGND